MFQNGKTAASGNNACRRKNKRWLWLVFVTSTILWMSRKAHAACPPTSSLATLGNPVTSFAKPAGSPSSYDIIGKLIFDGDSTNPCSSSHGLLGDKTKISGPTGEPYFDFYNIDASGNVVVYIQDLK